MNDAIRLFIFLLAFLAAPPAALLSEEVTGDWEIVMDFNGRQSFATLSIAKKPDGALTGKWGRTELADVKLEGQKLTFVRTLKMGDQEIKLNYEGTLSDGKLAGEISSERGKFAANGARKKPRSPALGRWDLKYTFGEREVGATLALSQGPEGTLEGKWTSSFGEHVVSDVKFQDGKLTFNRKSKFNDREMESTFEGTVKGHKLTGTIKSPRGEIAASGGRAGADLIGDWELTTTSDRGTRTGMLTVFGDMTGRYEIFGGEIPIKDLKLEGDQVSFSVEMGFGDQPIKMDFKGKMEGKTLNGELTTPMGERKVAGKKVEAASAAVGTWEFTRETPQGTRTSRLMIKEDMTGTYTSGDSKVDITDLRIDGDQVSFKVIRKFGEREVPMEFKGKVDGTALKGEFISARGNREATGKKVE